MNKIIPPDSCHFILDTLYVLPSSIVLKNVNTGQVIPEHLYFFDFNSSSLELSDTLCVQGDDLVVSYKTLAIPLDFTYRHKDFSVTGAEEVTDIQPSYEKSYNPYEGTGVIKHGNISRGVSVGNTQGASLQSSLDVRLSGKLREDIEILAVITDQNIPVQPEGNTHHLQEFDKVFIELKKDNFLTRFGDIEAKKPDGYFMNYFKKTQGGLFSGSFSSNRTIFSSVDNKQKLQLTAGISKGRFARNTFTGINGNQGPYKLTGFENEMFIVVLSGTERVYVNGELLQRGQNYDYVINYNTAELTFTSNRIITSDSRIVIEFEYSDKNYLRSLFTGNYHYSDVKTRFTLNFYSEQDARNQPLHQTLDDDALFVLQQAGDDPHASIVAGYDSTGFSDDYIMYAMLDTLGYDSVFVYSTNPDSAVYRVSFSFTGKGNGNYVHTQSLANGRVFKWVKPENGIPQGDYEPYIILITPKKQQMITAGIEHQLTEKITTGAELAVSNYDKNTFSPLDNKDNTGTAARMFIKHKSLIKTDSLDNKFYLLSELSYEFVEARFTPIDRFRPVEFDRDWNIRTDEKLANDHIITGGFSLLKNKNQILRGQADYYIKSDIFRGLKNELDFNFNKGIFNITNRVMYMSSERDSYTTDFSKQKGAVSAKLGRVVAGTGFEQEINLFRISADSLLNNSYDFIEFEPFLTTASDTSKVIFRTWYKQRHTKGTMAGSLRKAIVSEEYATRLKTGLSSQNQLAVTCAYRITNVKDTVMANINSDKTIITRLEHNLSLFKGSIVSFMFYEIGSGLEQKKEFTYLEVSPGQGQYKWVDYNQNGVKELDEFDPATYRDEANYLRIILPTNKYIRAYTLSFNETFVIEPSRVWGTDTVRFRKIISRFSNRMQYSLGKKSTSENAEDRFMPVLSQIHDASLINISSNFSNTFFFNRAHPVFSIRYRYSDNINKALIINGFDMRRVKTNEIHSVWNFSKTMGTETEIRTGNKENTTEMSFLRNYNISFIEFLPRLNFQPSVKQRYSLIARYSISENMFPGADEKANIITCGPDLRFSLFDKHVLNIRILYHQIKYNGVSNVPVAFEMLESLEAGKNLTWNFMCQFQISSSLQMSVMYEGRQTHNKRMIHFGNVQVKAML